MSAVPARPEGDVVRVLVADEDPEAIEALTSAMTDRASGRILRTSATQSSGLVSGSLPVARLVDILLGWIREGVDGLTVRCERDDRTGALRVRRQASGGQQQLVVGESDVFELGQGTRAEMEAAIRGLLGLAEDAGLKPERAAARFMWEPFDQFDPVNRLAPYVSPPALRGLGLNAGVPETLGPSDAATAPMRAAQLFDNLTQQGIAYARDPWMGLVTQQVRHPWWLIEDKWGTCLDLAVTYAAMCLQARIGALLAVPSAEAPKEGRLPHADHALVVVDPARVLHDGLMSAWAREWTGPTEYPLVDDPRSDGVAWVYGPDRVARLMGELDAGTLLAADVVAVTEGAGFDEALRRGRDWLGSGGALVDVAYLHTRDGFRPLPDPQERQRRFIRTYPQTGPDPGGVNLYPSQEDVLTELRGDSGVVVLLGPQGQGKSTVARQLQLTAPFGEGWFLNASAPGTLTSDLADADRYENNDTAAGLAALDRRGFADAALRRLEETPGRWVVVLDNADGDPGRITPLLPEVGPGQLVLVTSINSDWETVPGVRVRRLPPIDDVRVARDLNGDELVALVAGRALLLRAFGSLLSHTGATPAAIAAHAPAPREVSGPARGPATFWAALRAELAPDHDTLLLCLQCAYLPPDRQPLAALEALSPQAETIVRELARAGLLGFDPDSRTVRMHRLLGAAVRDDLRASDPDLDEEAVLQLATASESVSGALDKYGDHATLMRLDERLAEIAAGRREPDERLGQALHTVAALLELGGQTRRSGETYARAERHVQDRPDLLADVLHSRARTVNQHHARDEALLREALGWAKEAERLMLATPGREVGADRCYAMQGLLLQKLARFPGAGETTLGLQREALEVVEEAHRRRRERLDPMDPERARSEFNLAGPRINLAQLEPERAREHLDEAERIYIAVGEQRRKIYNRDRHPHITACIMGEAYAHYYRALLVPASRATRTAWLRTATARANAALEQRQAFDGSVDLDESRKVTRFLAKLALARAGSPATAARTVESVAAETSRELAFAAVETLPSRTDDVTGAISAWLFAPALAAVVEAFGQTPPDPATPLEEALAWFDEFSLRWDYRQGAERNLVAPQDLGADVGGVVMRAAAAQGLAGTSRPPGKHYDHVLVLGGLIRACIARPLYAAKLVEENVITADEITALGGFRELKGDELELAAMLGHAELRGEFDAMDAGVREAFSLGEPLAQSGERSDELGVSWEVREYGAEGGLKVRVVGAPSSEPGVRRATTADTYAWYGSELASLRAGERLLIVTTDIYVPYQHADALRMLGLPYSVEVDAVGVRPGDAHPALAQEFAPHNYLQEMRSTIRAFRELYEAGASGSRRAAHGA